MLPEALLDRFSIRISLGLPNAEEEFAIMERFIQNNPLKTLEPVCSLSDINKIQEQVAQVYIHEEISRYIVHLVMETRNHPQIAIGINPRGTLCLLRTAQAYALLNHRDYVTPDDVKDLIKPCFCHRLMAFNTKGGSTYADSILDEILDRVYVPTENFEKRS